MKTGILQYCNDVLLSSCRQTGELASEAKYPVLDNESTPVILGKLKVCSQTYLFPF